MSLYLDTPKNGRDRARGIRKNSSSRLGKPTGWGQANEGGPNGEAFKLSDHQVYRALKKLLGFNLVERKGGGCGKRYRRMRVGLRNTSPPRPARWGRAKSGVLSTRKNGRSGPVRKY